MNYCIMRFKKIKDAGHLAAALGHNTREKETLNANPEKTPENELIKGGSVEEGEKLYQERMEALSGPPRKNAVLAVDYMISATNGALGPSDREKYLKDALRWLEGLHGAENVIHASIHKDEKTDWHMHAIVVPIQQTEKGLKLRAKHWFDGKPKIQKLQSSFHQTVGERYGLSRGIEGSVAKHERVQNFYALVNAPPSPADGEGINTLTVPSSFKEMPTKAKFPEWIEALSARMKKAMAFVASVIRREQLVTLTERRAKADRKTLEAKEKELALIKRDLAGVPALMGKVNEAERKIESLTERHQKEVELIVFGSPEAQAERKEALRGMFHEMGQTKPKFLEKKHWHPDLVKISSKGPDRGVGW